MLISGRQGYSCSIMIYLSPALCSFLDFKIKRFRIVLFPTVGAGQVFKGKMTPRKRITVIKDKTSSPEVTQSQEKLRHIILSFHQFSLKGGNASVLFI